MTLADDKKKIDRNEEILEEEMPETELETEEDLPEAEATEEKEPETAEEEKKDEPSPETELLKAQLLRLQADFENFRARTERQRAETVAFANEGLITKLLGVLDNLERAMASGSPEDPVIQGIRLVYDEFLRILEAEGLEEIPADGEFDPNLHHAVMMEESEDVPSDHITETLQKGYRLQDRVIRPAMVKVAK